MQNHILLLLQDVIKRCLFPKVSNKSLNHHNFIQQKNSINKWRKIGYKLDPLSKIGTDQFDEFTDIPKFLKLIKKHSK